MSQLLFLANKKKQKTKNKKTKKQNKWLILHARSENFSFSRGGANIAKWEWRHTKMVDTYFDINEKKRPTATHWQLIQGYRVFSKEIHERIAITRLPLDDVLQKMAREDEGYNFHFL